MALSEHEKSVRAAVDKTERQNKIRSAEWLVEKAEKVLKAANDAASKARDEVKAAQLKLDAVREQDKVANGAAKRDSAPVIAAPSAVIDPLKETA